jgi:hypothetical protein
MGSEYAIGILLRCYRSRVFGFHEYQNHQKAFFDLIEKHASKGSQKAIECIQELIQDKKFVVDKKDGNLQKKYLDLIKKYGKKN